MSNDTSDYQTTNVNNIPLMANDGDSHGTQLNTSLGVQPNTPISGTKDSTNPQCASASVRLRLPAPICIATVELDKSRDMYYHVRSGEATQLLPVIGCWLNVNPGEEAIRQNKKVARNHIWVHMTPQSLRFPASSLAVMLGSLLTVPKPLQYDKLCVINPNMNTKKHCESTEDTLKKKNLNCCADNSEKSDVIIIDDDVPEGSPSGNNGNGESHQITPHLEKRKPIFDATTRNEIVNVITPDSDIETAKMTTAPSLFERSLLQVPSLGVPSAAANISSLSSSCLERPGHTSPVTCGSPVTTTSHNPYVYSQCSLGSTDNSVAASRQQICYPYSHTQLDPNEHHMQQSSLCPPDNFTPSISQGEALFPHVQNQRTLPSLQSTNPFIAVGQSFMSTSRGVQSAMSKESTNVVEAGTIVSQSENSPTVPIVPPPIFIMPENITPHEKDSTNFYLISPPPALPTLADRSVQSNNNLPSTVSTVLPPLNPSGMRNTVSTDNDHQAKNDMDKELYISTNKSNSFRHSRSNIEELLGKKQHHRHSSSARKRSASQLPLHLPPKRAHIIRDRMVPYGNPPHDGLPPIPPCPAILTIPAKLTNHHTLSKDAVLPSISKSLHLSALRDKIMRRDITSSNDTNSQARHTFPTIHRGRHFGNHINMVNNYLPYIPDRSVIAREDDRATFKQTDFAGNCNYQVSSKDELLKILLSSNSTGNHGNTPNNVAL